VQGSTRSAMTLTSEPLWRQRQLPSASCAQRSSGRSAASRCRPRARCGRRRMAAPAPAQVAAPVQSRSTLATVFVCSSFARTPEVGMMRFALAGMPLAFDRLANIERHCHTFITVSKQAIAFGTVSNCMSCTSTVHLQRDRNTLSSLSVPVRIAGRGHHCQPALCQLRRGRRLAR